MIAVYIIKIARVSIFAMKINKGYIMLMDQKL